MIPVKRILDMTDLTDFSVIILYYNAKLVIVQRIHFKKPLEELNEQVIFLN